MRPGTAALQETCGILSLLPASCLPRSTGTLFPLRSTSPELDKSTLCLVGGGGWRVELHTVCTWALGTLHLLSSNLQEAIALQGYTLMMSPELTQGKVASFLLYS